MSNQEILTLRFNSDDLGRELSIKEYLQELLLELFKETDCFSGKRPFGNSGWQYDLAKPLVDNKIISGTVEDLGDGDIDYDYSQKEFDELMIELIKAL